MDNITIREMKAEETPKLVEWLLAHKKINQVDFEPFRRNQVKIYVAETDSGEILAFIPVKWILEYDALSPKPGISSYQLTRVCQAMTKHLIEEAKQANIPAIRVQPNDEKFSNCLKCLGYFSDEREQLIIDVNNVKDK